jgi:hypothetical protein
MGFHVSLLIENPSIFDVAMCFLLLLGGNETTTNLLGNTAINTVITLLKYPTELARVRRDISLATKVFEEMLRYESPVQGIFVFKTLSVGAVPYGVAFDGRKASRPCAAFADLYELPIERPTEWRSKGDLNRRPPHLSKYSARLARFLAM